MSEQRYQLPDLLRDWPWSRQLSTYYLEAKKESSAWVSSFRPFCSRGQKAFDACDLNLLASLTYSNRDRDFVRVGCDLMNFYFVYDEYTDVGDVSVARSLASTVISAMKDPEAKPDNPHILGEMTRQFWKQASTLAARDSPCFERFIATSETYLNAVVEEAEDRAQNRIRPVQDYLRLRRDTCGARPTLVLIEFGLNLPREVTDHSTLVSLTQDAVDLIILVNDMHSYSREISCGLAYHNIITTIMNEYRLDLRDALTWLGTYTDAIVSRFLSNIKQIPSWDPDTDRRVRTYVDGLGQWVRGNDDWSYESKRYYGNDGLSIREDRILKLRRRTGNYLNAEFEVDTDNGGRNIELRERQASCMNAFWEDWRLFFSLGALAKTVARKLSFSP
ncbi:hypothetical protein M413DRAFT_27416 [Hebeloma cylindrosporum]|uniref:Terpene synthase n=1 Tax=Hebeloma cylindrosporum TaxID=76867 RepID=A0A0C2YLE7_HEBCY|nr:hypothetical protein M413DRAFT_27416 [Hebeloma cylindrosporum h7]